MQRTTENCIVHTYNRINLHEKTMVTILYLDWIRIRTNIQEQIFGCDRMDYCFFAIQIN